jgi:hypothetical protein
MQIKGHTDTHTDLDTHTFLFQKLRENSAPWEEAHAGWLPLFDFIIVFLEP